MVAAVLLLATSPLLLVLWAAVRVDTSGSGFHVSTRVGGDGRLFRMVELRTMHAGAGPLSADAFASGAVPFAIRRDPRVTRVGYWLRRWSLDVLPQLVNVVRGEMALVGPRPARPDEVADDDVLDRRRPAVRPGMVTSVRGTATVRSSASR